METPKNTSEKDQVLNFIKLCLRYWYYFVISGAVCLVLGIWYLKVKTPVYAINAQVTLRHDESLSGATAVSGSGMLSSLGMGSGKENIEDETLKLSSENNVKEVVKNLKLNISYQLSECWGFSKTNLYDYSPIIVTMASEVGDTLVDKLQMDLKVAKDGSATLKIKYNKIKYPVVTIASFPATIHSVVGDLTFSVSENYAAYKKPLNLKILCLDYDYAAQIYQKQLTIDFHKKNSDLITLDMQSEDVVQAKKILRTLVDVYNVDWNKDKDYVYQSTMDYIDRRLGIAKTELSTADQQIQEFKTKHQLTDIASDVKFNFAVSAEVQSALLEKETQLNLTTIIADFVQDETNRYSLIPFSLTTATDKTLGDAISQYNTELMRRNELYSTNTQSGLVKSLDNQLDEQRKNLLQSLTTIRKEINSALTTIRKKDREIAQKNGMIPTIEQDFSVLVREQALQQNIYGYLLQKREEAGVRAAVLMPKLKMVDAPYVLNQRVAPRLIKVAMAVALGTVCVSLLLLYGIPYLKTLRRKED
jgi:uncharacterized protein involved in exopolysaccharide biosynthesis